MPNACVILRKKGALCVCCDKYPQVCPTAAICASCAGDPFAPGGKSGIERQIHMKNQAFLQSPSGIGAKTAVVTVIDKRNA